MQFAFAKKTSLTFTTILTMCSLPIAACSNNSNSQPVIHDANSSNAIGYNSAQSNNSQDETALSSGATVQDKVNLYLQLLQPNAASAGVYSQFLNQNPTWPNRSYLLKQMQKALILETDMNAIQTICQNQPLTLSSALTFCAQQGQSDKNLTSQAREAWVKYISSPNDEQEMLSVFGKDFTQEDQWNRFKRLESSGLLSAASRQTQYLTSSQQSLASVILAFRRNQATAENQLTSLNKEQLQNPELVYARLRWLRSQDRNDEALHLWQEMGFQAERNANQKRFWVERNNLIRNFLSNGNNKAAYTLAATEACSVDNSTCLYDSNFLAGWIALRKMNNADKSIGYFKKLTEAKSVLTSSRGYYWLGRAYQAKGDRSASQQAWQQAAQLPTTFYGQMAIAELNNIKESIVLNPALLNNIITKYLEKVPEQSISSSDISRFKNRELVQAAQILVSQNDLAHARPFLLSVNKIDNNISTQAVNARVSNEFGLADDAVAIARNAGSKGTILLKDGWPRPYSIPASSLPSGLELGIMRQESSFNPSIVSPSKAYGLMQLLPSTAREVAVQMGLPAKMGNPGNLVVPQNNIKLGTTYLEKLMTRFNNVIPYSVAGYNGGPNRVKKWLTSIGDPAAAGNKDDVIDWIEQIPYTETRNYVQRVIENTIIYQTNINK